MPPASKDPLLALERAERADVRNGECNAELRFVAGAEVQAAILDADAAAIGVVGHLRGGELQCAFFVIVIEADAGIPALAIRVAPSERGAQLVGGRRQNGV